MKVIKLYLVICQSFTPFILSLVFLLHICKMLCIVPSYHRPCGSPFVPFTWRHLQWGHIYRTPTLAVHNPPEPKQTSVSKWAMALIFLFFFILPFPGAWWRMKSLTPAPLPLWGRQSSISDPFWCNWILHTECKMENDLGVPLLPPFFLCMCVFCFLVFFCFLVLFFFIWTNQRSSPQAIWEASLCGRTDVLNDDRWQKLM